MDHDVAKRVGGIEAEPASATAWRDEAEPLESVWRPLEGEPNRAVFGEPQIVGPEELRERAGRGAHFDFEHLRPPRRRAALDHANDSGEERGCDQKHRYRPKLGRHADSTVAMVTRAIRIADSDDVGYHGASRSCGCDVPCAFSSQAELALSEPVSRSC